jgi:hypothetical protein
VVVALADRDYGGVVMRASGLSFAEVARTGFLTPNGGTAALSATLRPLSAIRQPLPTTLFEGQKWTRVTRLSGSVVSSKIFGGGSRNAAVS